MHTLQTAPEFSPAYHRALAALTAEEDGPPPPRALTEDGLEDHCRPPSYECIAGDRTVNPWKWTTDSTEPDTPGRRRRLLEGDWRKMREWAGLVAGEGEVSSRGLVMTVKDGVELMGGGGEVVGEAEAVATTLRRGEGTMMGRARGAETGEEREARGERERRRRVESERVNAPFAGIGRGRGRG
ncbi:hypothetical protein MMC27_003230 [Xylographa pallens]|nr:hypothetical protein [Xylographa pallens]